MNILIFIWRDIKNPSAGGSEVYFHELSKYFISKGHKVTWITSRWKGCKKREIVDGIKIIRTGNFFSVYLYAFIEYIKLKKKPDKIIDVENGIPFFTPLFSNAKIILHIHHVHKDIWKREIKRMKFIKKIIPFIGYILEMKIMPKIYRKNLITTVSESSKNDILKNQISKNEKLIKMVEPGIKQVKYKNTKKTKTPSILFLNRIKEYKGIKVFLDAIKELNAMYPEMKVWVAGKGDELENMKNYAKTKQIKNVDFLGKVSESKKIELLKKSWIFVNPSFKEGWGIVNIESSYFGTPVIGSNVDGIKDSIKNNETGLLFNPGDAKDLSKKIVKLIENPKLRKSLGLKGKNYAKLFSWKKKSQEYLNILERL